VSQSFIDYFRKVWGCLYVVKFGEVLGGWLGLLVVKGMVLFLYMVLRVLFVSMRLLGVETPFMNCRALCPLGVRHNVVVVHYLTY